VNPLSDNINFIEGHSFMPSHTTLLLFGTIAVLAGVASALQTTMNAALGRSLDDPITAALWSFVTGAAVMVAIYMVRGGNLTSQSLSSAPLWSLFGGAMGCLMVLSVIIAVPRIGLMTALIAIALGQSIASIAFDALGVLGQPKAVSPQRVAALFCLLIGFWASRA
jgi:bacterial/archaeal transporter family-2 protein